MHAPSLLPAQRVSIVVLTTARIRARGPQTSASSLMIAFTVTHVESLDSATL